MQITDWVAAIAASEAAAAWAQAVGATVAIGLTWWLARGENRARQRTEIDQMKVALFLMADAFDHLSRTSRGFENQDAIIRVANKILHNDALSQTRQSIIRAEERGGIPVAALSALVSSSADVTRALAIAKTMNVYNAVEVVPAYRGAVATLKNRCRSLAAHIHKRGGYLEADDPVLLHLWLKKSPRQRLRRLVMRPIALWSLSRDGRVAHFVRRSLFAVGVDSMKGKE